MQQHDGVRKSPAIMELFPTFTLARARNQLKVFKSRKLFCALLFLLGGKLNFTPFYSPSDDGDDDDDYDGNGFPFSNGEI